MAKKKESTRYGFSILLKILATLTLLLFIACVIKTCSNCKRINKVTIVDRTGYLPDKENWDNIPDVQPPYNDDELDSLPEAVSLEHLFPPIGDQGRYGTCVAWATGYNLKTALNAIDNKWTPEQLKDPKNQTSPKDLWMGVPSDSKGKYCEGTIFEAAFSVLKSKGASTMAKVPYSNLGTCNGSFTGSADNKIAGFNHVVSPSIKQIKAYLSDTIPLVFAANVGNVFVNWHGDKVFKAFDNGQKGGHAMVISGYDDSKHAFRIRNSWGVSWGDKGSAWVDYDFFMNDFCEEIFMAKNQKQYNISNNKKL